jgi:SAM-dependent methyltransferase
MASTVDEGYFAHIKEHPEISAEDVAIIRRLLPGARRIVDVGCGRGGFVQACAGSLGFDSEPAAARICRAQHLPFVLGDAEHLPFASDSLDVVRAKEIIEHLPDPLPMLRGIARALKPGGFFLSHTPSHFSALYPVNNFWDDYTHVRPYSKFGLRRLLEDAGLEVQSIRGYTAGRNGAERLLGRALALAAPHTWLAIARKPSPEIAGVVTGHR